MRGRALKKRKLDQQLIRGQLNVNRGLFSGEDIFRRVATAICEKNSIARVDENLRQKDGRIDLFARGRGQGREGIMVGAPPSNRGARHLFCAKGVQNQW